MALLLGTGAEIAYLDLSQPTKNDNPTAGASIAVRGGAIFDGPTPQFLPPQVVLPLTLREIEFAISADANPSKAAIEVTITNTGSKPLSVPIGTEAKSLLAQGTNRQYLSFQVTFGKRPEQVIGWARMATNGEHPETIAVLSPRDYITIKIPFDKGLLEKVKRQKDADTSVGVTATLCRMVTDKGIDFSEQISKTIISTNSLEW